MDWVLNLVGMAYLFFAPYTKVEESFNLQAIHDILYHGTNISQYDHLEFSGVVPRTFLGPLLISGLASPIVLLARILRVTKLGSQVVVRAILGLLVLEAFRRFRKSVERHFGPVTGIWLVLVTAVQFHFNFYLSRPLPNTFAMAAVLLAYSYWLEQRPTPLIITTAFSVLVLRFELALLLGLVLLAELSSGRLSIRKLLAVGIPAGLGSLALTIAVDSWFWQRPLWPEGEVIWFNLILNRSHEYGTQPWGWYFYSALPRCLNATGLLALGGLLLDSRCRSMALPALSYVVLYSCLPHKELRFVLYVVPVLNVAAARACTALWHSRLKSFKHVLALLSMCMLLVLNLLASCMLLYISANNYPGGMALSRLHKIEPRHSDVSVHIDVFTAQTGASRFGELHPNWRGFLFCEFKYHLEIRNTTMCTRDKQKKNYKIEKKKWSDVDVKIKIDIS
ncbi:ALG12 [Cordylochernes scorpioides]|uniref:Mannosyltransferase n=1 Tax=Cordylochernes scorpioides TaxID=51811 RepID=A0ABY6LF64_9ARAC|nr:ALG12 [Cordylochernes scorpioides]